MRGAEILIYPALCIRPLARRSTSISIFCGPEIDAVAGGEILVILMRMAGVRGVKYLVPVRGGIPMRMAKSVGTASGSRPFATIPMYAAEMGLQNRC